MSFNVGPTLLTWLEREAPGRAPARSSRPTRERPRFAGHGSAMAQAYNHVILPLANQRDKVTQVRWGIADFEHRFGRRTRGDVAARDRGRHRDPRGRWPGRASGSPCSAPIRRRAVEAAMEPGRDVERRADRHPGALCYRPGRGSVHRRLLLRRRRCPGRSPSTACSTTERRWLIGWSRLRETRRWPRAGHVATDGETYGHHHRHGEMALAYALETIDARILGSSHQLSGVPLLGPADRAGRDRRGLVLELCPRGRTLAGRLWLSHRT